MMTDDEPWMRPYVLSITGLFVEEGFARLAEALGRRDPAAADATLARFEDMIEREIAGIGEGEDIPPPVLAGLRDHVRTRMAATLAKARQRLGETLPRTGAARDGIKEAIRPAEARGEQRSALIPSGVPLPWPSAAQLPPRAGNA